MSGAGGRAETGESMASRARTLVVAIGVVLVLACASALDRAEGAGPAKGPVPCDPIAEVCLLTPAPWISPQKIRYEAPAATTSLRVRWTRGARSGGIREIEQVGAGPDTTTWKANLPPRLRNGRLKLEAKARPGGPEAKHVGEVRRASANHRFAIVRDGSRYFARLRLRARADLRVRLQVSLRARYPAERWKTVNRWKTVRSLSAGGGKEVRLTARRARRKCKQFGSCKLQAHASVHRLGSVLAKRSDGKSVPTPPERFSGQLGTVSGSTGRSGPGRLYRYSVHVEKGIKIDRKGFAGQVKRTLFDRRGWGRTGRVGFQQVSRASDGNTRVILASPNLVDRLCYPLQTRGYVSCTQGSSVILNLNRWRYAVPHFGSRTTYRRMLVNHEIGHRIGHGHRNCSGRGRKAPVMQQQTYGLQGCRANAWPLDSEARVAKDDPSSPMGGWKAWLE